MNADNPDVDARSPRARWRLPPWRHRLGAIARHSVEVLAVIFAAMVVVCAGVIWRLSQGPVSLEPFRPDIEAALARAFQGQDTHIGEVQAAWSRNEHSVVVSLTDVTVRDNAGNLVVAAPRLLAGVDVGALITGRVEFSRIQAQGGAISVLRSRQGQWYVGFESLEELKATAAERPRAAVEPDRSAEERPRMGEVVTQLPSALQQLTAVRVTDASLEYEDQRLGVRVDFSNVDAGISRRGRSLRLAIAGEALSAGDEAKLALSLLTDEGMSEFAGELEVTNVRPALVLDRDGPLGVIAKLDAPADLALTGIMSRNAKLRSGELSLALGEGRILGHVNERAFTGGALLANYDAARDELVVTDAQIAGVGVNGQVSGVIEGLATFGRTSPLAFDVTAQGIEVDTGGVFPDPLGVDELVAKGVLLVDRSTVTFQTLSAKKGDVQGTFAGLARVEAMDDGRRLPAILLDGKVTGPVRKPDVLSYWPSNFALGARDWIEDAVIGGTLSDIDISVNIPAEALARRELDDEHLRIAFDFRDASARLISTMSPITSANGRATLLGNQFELDMRSGQMAGLALADGYVKIPRLQPKGQPAHFGAVGRGEAQSALNLIDEPPLNFVSDFGLSADSFSGEGVIKADIMRPMLRDVPVEDMDYTVSAEFSNASGPSAIPGMLISEAAVSMTVDPEAIITKIDGRLGPAPAKIVWTEALGDDVALSSTFEVETVIDSTVLDAIGAPSRTFLSGEVPAKIFAQGEEMSIRALRAELDLTPAALRLPLAQWGKVDGAPGEAKIEAQINDDGGFELTNMAVTIGEDRFNGSMGFGADKALERIQISSFALRDIIDVRGELNRTSDGGFEIDLVGESFDARLVAPFLTQGDDGELGVRINLNANLERVRITDGDVISDLSLSFQHDGGKLETLAFEAQSDEGPISILAYPEPDSADRRMRLRAPNAGLLFEALYQSQQLRGGQVAFDALLPPLDAPEGAAGEFELRVNNFELVDAPILARILSIASIRGFSDTMAGEGIAFDRMRALGLINGDVVTVDKAIIAGPSLGLTFTGEVDLDQKLFDLSGVLAPAYAINSAFGDIPLVGEWLVSRQGEGVIGVTFTVRGPMDETRVMVNPLSALTPGVLRRIFQIGRDAEGAAPEEYRRLLSPGE